MADKYAFGIVDTGQTFYKSYGSISGNGEVAVLTSPQGGFAIIFTDRQTAGGVASCPGQDNAFANKLGAVWCEKANSGVNPGVVFDAMCHTYEAESVEHYENLSELCFVTGFGEPLVN